jgi:hypothetical protein
MKIKQTFTFIFVFLLVFILTGCSQAQQEKNKTQEQTKQETTKSIPEDEKENPIPSDWQTYENQTHKLTLFYPSSWTLAPEIDKENLLTFSLSRNDDSQEMKTFWNGAKNYPYYALNVRIESNPQNLKPLDWAVKQVIPQAKEEAKKRYKEISLGSLEGIYESGPVEPSGIMYHFIFCPENNKAYSFTYQADAFPKTQEKFLAEIKKIINLAKLQK